MPFTYRYANDDPPAPFVLVVVARIDGTRATADLPAKVDTGADQTVIPAELANGLALREVGRVRFGGLGGHEAELPIYEIRLVIRDLAPITVEVAASEGEPHVLLGRDVLNRYKIVLDGPNGKLAIG